MVRCPKCGFENRDDALTCANCRVNLQFAIANLEQLKEQGVIADPSQVAKHQQLETEHRQRLANLLITTTPSIEGRQIARYLGIISSVVILGAGSWSTFKAEMAGGWGKRATGVEEKLKEARELALEDLKQQASRLGGNAIVGLDLDYLTFVENTLMVSANGTLVKLSEMKEAVE